MVRPRLLFLAPALLGLLSGCGGSGGGKVHTVTLIATRPAEGPIEGTRDPFNNIQETSSGLQIGDRENQVPQGPVRAFLSFNIDPIPDGATIDSAVLRLNMISVAGNPFDQGPTGLGNLMVDQVNYGNNFPTDTSYAGNTILGLLATLSTNATLGLKNATVTFAVNNDYLAGKSQSQFRLRFYNRDQNLDSNDTYALFVDSEDLTMQGNPPALIITYTIPN